MGRLIDAQEHHVIAKPDEVPTMGEPARSAWTDDLGGVPPMRTIFLELTRDDGYMAYGVGYMDTNGAFQLVSDDDDFNVGEEARWRVVRWLDPTRA